MTFDPLLPPEPHCHLMVIGTGTGKSHAARLETKRIVQQLPEASCLVIAAPTHALNDEHLERLRVLLRDDGVDVAVYRGRGAKDPARPGHDMCDYADEAAELSGAGGDAAQLCSRKKDSGTVHCKSYDDCGYRKQYELTPSVWIVPHALLTRRRPACIPDVAALIIDEDPWQTFLGGFGGRPVRVSLDELRTVRRVPFKAHSNKIDNAKTADLEATSSALRQVLSNMEGLCSPITVQGLSDAGITAETAHDARLAVLQTKQAVDVSPELSPAVRQERMAAAAKHNKPIFRLARLYKLIGNAIGAGFDVVPGCRFERGVQSSDDSQFDAVRLRWSNPLHADWHQPTIILSATAQTELLQHIWPQVQTVAEVNPQAPHAKVRQILWSASKAKLKNNNHMMKIKHYIEARAFEFRGRGAVIDGRRVDVLVIAQLEAEEALKSLCLPENVDTAHLNAVEGIDKWKDVACLISIGRTMASHVEVALMAEVLSGSVVESVGEWYPREYVGIRVNGAGEVGHPTLMEVHPDPIAEAVRWSIAEAGVLQAIGRGRAVNRSENDPLQIDIISTLVLPLAVDEVLGDDAIKPDPFTVMAGRGLVVANSASHGKWGVVQKALPDLFPTEDAARKALSRTNAYIYSISANVRVSTFTPATVKLVGARYAVPVLIDGNGGEPREVAEKLLGPLEQFNVITDVPAPITYIDIPFEDAKPVPPPVNPVPPSLAVWNEPEAETPEPENQAVSFDAIVEKLTGGFIPEPADLIEATRIFLGMQSAEANVPTLNCVNY